MISIQSDVQSSVRNKWSLLGKCFLWGLLIKAIASILILITESAIFDGHIPLFEKQIKLTDTYSLEYAIVLLVFVYPILEEFAFRGWFSNNKFLTVISLSVLLFYFFYILLNILIVGLLPVPKVYRNIILISIIAIGFYIFYKNFLKLNKVIEFYHVQFIIFSIVFFSIIHAFNYRVTDLNLKTLLGYFIVLLPYPFAAFIYTYVRIKNGLMWSILLHIVNNSFILIPALLLGKKI